MSLPCTHRAHGEPGQLCFWRWRGQHTVAYEKYGSGSVPLVLVHGMGACHEHWNKLIPEMGPQYVVYAIDLLGEWLARSQGHESSAASAPDGVQPGNCCVLLPTY